MKSIILGSRGSQLALWQTHYILDLLREKYPQIEFTNKIITTKGDRIQDKPLPEIGGKGLFTEEIEDALLDESIHIAVHSLKDLPSSLPEGLIYAGSPVREDARDAFISTRWKSVSDLPENAKVATGSMRRRSLLLGLKPDLNIGDLRGNIDTRLRKLRDEGWDGIIMAAAALKRLEMKENISELLEPSIFVPSVGQGAIGLEIKASRTDVLELVKGITHEETEIAVLAERAFMRSLEGGCSVPLGAYGTVKGNDLELTGYFSSTDGKNFIRETMKGEKTDPEKLGIELANLFRSKNVETLMS